MIERISFQVYQNQEQPFAFDQGLLLFFGLSGSSCVLCGSNEYELGAAGVLAVNPFELYRLQNRDGGSLLCLRIDRQMLQFAGWPEEMRCSCYAQDGSQNATGYLQLRTMYANVFQTFFQTGVSNPAVLNSPSCARISCKVNITHQWDRQRKGVYI